MFLGNRIGDDQAPFFMALASGFCQEREVDVVLWERKPSQKVLDHPEIKKFTEGLQIRYLDEEDFSSAEGTLRSRLETFLSLPLCFWLAWRCSRRQLWTSRGSWMQVQLLHAVWDQALQAAPDGTLHLAYWRRLRAAIRVVATRQFARRVLKEFGVIAAFLGHTVYTGRALLAEFRRQDVEVYANSAWVIYRLPKDADVGSSIMTTREWEAAFSLVDRGEVEDFWRARSSGDATYEDAALAAVGKSEVSASTPRNLILLHIFRDSPFNVLDRSRIFADYVEWVQETLRLVARSQESWMVRLHPSADRWGESQIEWVQSIIADTFGNSSIPDNIMVVDTASSNLALFRHVDRVVTFNGTAHLEAACFGIRPIVVTDVALSSLDKDLVLKPKSRSSYRDMLLKPAHHDDYRLSTLSSERARKALFVREEMLSLQSNVGILTRYRGDSADIANRSTESVLAKTPEFAAAVIDMGRNLALGIPRTTKIEFFEGWSALLK